MSRFSQLEQALQEGSFSSSHHSGEPCDRTQLLKRLLLMQRDTLTPEDTLEAALARQKPVQLPRYDANVLYFCDQLFTLCQLKAEIDPSLLEQFMLLRPVVAAILLEHGIAGLSEHPLIDLLNRLWYASLYWTPSLGKAGEKYQARIGSMLQQLHSTNPARADYVGWLATFSDQLDKEFQRGELLASRISQAERERWIRNQSRQIVQHNVNTVLQRANMPDAVEALLKGPWATSLHQTLLQHGLNSPQWQQLFQFADRVLDSVQPPATEAERHHLFKLIPRIPGLLRKQLVSISADEIDQWIATLEALHLTLLTGGTLVLHAAAPLPLVDAHGNGTAVNSALIQQITCIHEGQWLVYHTEQDDALLCRLAVKLEDAGQLLFVNVFGAKTLQKSFAEFAYLLASKHIHLLNTDSNFSQCVRDTLDQFLLMHRFHQMLQLDAAEWRRKEQQRLQRETQRRQHAQQKAKQEAEQRAHQQQAEHAQRVRQQQEAAKRQRLQAMEDALAQARQDSHAHLDTLTVGAWLSLDRPEPVQRCKVAAILNKGELFILVNREGIKVAEWSRQRLHDALLAGDVSVLENGERFGNSLATLIKQLRQP